jgi:hypothetical protein
MGPLPLMQDIASRCPFLSVRVCKHLAAVQAELNAAEKFVLASRVLKKAEEDEFAPLSKILVGPLRELVRSRSLNVYGPKADLIAHVRILAASPAYAADALLQRLIEVDLAEKVV